MKDHSAKDRSAGLSAGHLTMMALGTVIGGSFFLGSVVAIRAAGPAVVISYILGGLLVYFILFALSEMTVADPDYGSFRAFAAKAYGPGLGFVTGWVYWTGLILGMSSEAVALSILLRGWAPGIALPVMGSAIIVAVTLLNLLGAEQLSKLESGLAAVKLLAIIGFIVLAVALIFGLGFGFPRLGMGALTQEAWFPGGIGGIAGSMLIVMFAYAGFEVISLAASETSNPHRTVPRAIAYTVIGLTGLYVTTAVVLLPLIPVDSMTVEKSPLVLALTRWNLGWAGTVMNLVMVTAIFSTMLAAMFGLARMIRSLADQGQAPRLLLDRGEVPYKGILFSGAAMLAGLFLGFILPNQVYIFLVSSGGYSLLFTYLVILLSHYKFRGRSGCPPEGKCQLPGYPFTSWLAIAGLVAIILSMPLIPGQGAGLLAGVLLTLFYTGVYSARKYVVSARRGRHFQPQMETAEELVPDISKKDAGEKKIGDA